MKYKIREKVFSIGDSFAIEDEQGRTAYKVKSKLLSIGDKLVMEDADGKTVARIRQKLLRFVFEKYIIEMSDGQKVEVTQRLKLMPGTKFSMTGGYEVRGSVLDRDFSIVRSGQPVAVVSKKFFTLTDTYGVEISSSENAPLLLAVVIVLDQIFHDGNEAGPSE